MKLIVRNLIFLLALGMVHGLGAQAIAEGIPYQAVARDASGRPLGNMPVVLKVVLGDLSNPAFEEMHEAQTDERGLFSIVVGEGRVLKGAFAQVPWVSGDVWMEVAVQDEAKRAFQVLSSSRLLAVPYAMHALSASKIPKAEDQEEEKNQSIYWTTGGNSLTVPGPHFLGTRDNQDLIFKTNNIKRMAITKEGKMELFAGSAVDGPKNLKSSYPMIVEGSNQGIYIKVNGSRSEANHFLNFGDDVEFTWGAVQGLTWPEQKADWEYVLQDELYTINYIALAASVVNQILAAAGFTASGLAAYGAIGIGLEIAALGIDIGNAINEEIQFKSNLEKEVGVTYATGSGDYAEWLERTPGERKLQPGQVVGVRNGMVSLSTQDADHFMVVSTMPAVLGNMPQVKDKDRFEKIAFMGQVPVWVAGPVAIGDYILPSGNDDGFAIAVHPEKMKIGDYKRIIGVAWEDGKQDMNVHFINTAVGTNANDMSREIVALEQRIEAITAYLKGESTSFRTDGSMPALADHFSTGPKVASAKILPDEWFNQVLEQHEPQLKEIMQHAKAQLIRRGNKLEESPEVLHFLDNPVPVMKKIRSNPAYTAYWAEWDKNFLEQTGGR